MNDAQMLARATVYAAVYAAVMGNTHQETPRFKIDRSEIRERAEEEAKRAVKAWDSMRAAEDDAAARVRR